MARTAKARIPVEDKVRIVLETGVPRRRREGPRATPEWPGRNAGWPGGTSAADRERTAKTRPGRGYGAAAHLAAERHRIRAGPFVDLEALRAAAGLPVSRFARLADIPERTYRRRLMQLRAGIPDRMLRPSPQVDRFEPIATKPSFRRLDRLGSAPSAAGGR